MGTAFSIRHACAKDLSRFAAIERDAAQLYRTVGYDYCADGPVRSNAEHARALAAGMAHVADAQASGVVGFIIAWPADGHLHLVELAVQRAHQGAGIGRALIAAAEVRAREDGHAETTLTTYRDVPWNAPAYARMGYSAFTPGPDRPDLRAIQAGEAGAGFARWPRVAMRKNLLLPRTESDPAPRSGAA